MEAPRHNDGTAARTLPFRQGPRLVISNDVTGSDESSCATRKVDNQGRRLQLVPQIASGTQEYAHRIVREVEQEQIRRWDAMRPLPPLRSQDFWNTLPLPESRRETPLTVVRRLVHTLFPPAKTA